mmetsp:Transcript_14595/g.37779  ORF Transcript_14595/g.37779 Transcript_14595/m.37779 type:complete len:420 (-) Transcript_14595:10-1269(-)
MARLPSPKNSSAQPCTKMAAFLGSETSARQTSGPTKGRRSSFQSAFSMPLPPTTVKLELTSSAKAHAATSTTTSVEVCASAGPSSKPMQHIAPTASGLAGGLPARTMTWRKGRFTVRFRQFAVNSSSMSSHFACLLPKNESNLKPPFPACAPMWLNRRTFVHSGGTLAKMALNPFFVPSTAVALSSPKSGHTAKALQFTRSSSNFSKGNLAASSKSIKIVPLASSANLATKASPGPAPRMPQTAIRSRAPAAPTELPPMVTAGFAANGAPFMISSTFSPNAACRLSTSSANSSSKASNPSWKASSSASAAASSSSLGPSPPACRATLTIRASATSEAEGLRKRRLQRLPPTQAQPTTAATLMACRASVTGCCGCKGDGASANAVAGAVAGWTPGGAAGTKKAAIAWYDLVADRWMDCAP